MNTEQTEREQRAVDALIAASLALSMQDRCEDSRLANNVHPDCHEPQNLSDFKSPVAEIVSRMIATADALDPTSKKDASNALKEVGNSGSGELLVHSDQPSERALTNILIGIRESFGFEAGLIYIADYSARVLRCSAYIDSEQVSVNHRGFSYGFDETSAASKIFRDKAGHFSADPVRDPAFNRSGLRGFRISGPIVGVPLLIGARVVGVLIVWSRHNRPPAPHHIHELRLFACLAAGAISQWEIRSQTERTEVLQTLQLLHARQLLGVFGKEYLVRLLLAIRQAGFERARVFKYNRERQIFYCLGSLAVEKNWVTPGAELRIAENAYARDIEETFLSNNSARIYGPGSPKDLGDDPDASVFGTPPQLPWAAVPLIVDGELFGQIIADNAVTTRQISRESLEHLGVLAGVVSQGVAKSQHARALDDLKAFYASLAEVLPKCILQKDLEGHFVYVNQQFCDRLGKSKKEVIGKTDYDLYPRGLAEKFRRDDKLVIRTGAPLERIEENIQPDGTIVMVRVFKAAVRDSLNQIVGVHCIFWDVTKQRLAEEELLQIPPTQREEGDLMPGRYRHLPTWAPAMK